MHFRLDERKESSVYCRPCESEVILRFCVHSIAEQAREAFKETVNAVAVIRQEEVSVRAVVARCLHVNFPWPAM